jgi:hypothetical protein
LGRFPWPGQIDKKSFAPTLDIVCDEHLEQCVVTGAALVKRHGQRLFDRRCDCLRVVGVDEERGGTFDRGTCKPRQDKDAWFFWILARNILLSDKVHTIPQRGHQGNVR